METIATVSDKGNSDVFFATLCPSDDVAIDKDSAELFSIYQDMGIPIFMKMRVQSGKYVIKAGDCVIVKTLEAKTIPLESTTNKKSSVWSNDIICLAEDTPIEDFRTNYPVADGKYIYMLTNMEKNGGFGFTCFTGTTMKKGNFYIVSTREPETTAIQAVKSATTFCDGAVYSLQGMRVQNPIEGQIYIQHGRKFVKRSNFVSRPSQEQSTTVIPVMTRADKDIEDGDPVPFLPGEAIDDDGF